jgi:hypothetical protein
VISYGEHEYKTTEIRQTEVQIKQKVRDCNLLRLFTFKRKFLKTSTDLQTALAAEAHLADGQWLDEPLNTMK